METLYQAVESALREDLRNAVPGGLRDRYLDPARLAEVVMAVLQDPGRHRYLSTGCLHGDHDHCNCAWTRDGQPKTPGVCKFCAAPCECGCHRPATDKPLTSVSEV